MCVWSRRFCSALVRVAPRRLPHPLGPARRHERQNAGRSFQNRLDLQVKIAIIICWFAGIAEIVNFPLVHSLLADHPLVFNLKLPWQNCVCMVSLMSQLSINNKSPFSNWTFPGLTLPHGSICRRELPFTKTAHLSNPWNEHKPVKIGRDGQVRLAFLPPYPSACVSMVM